MSFFRLATRSLSRSTFASARTPSRFVPIVPRARYSAAASLQKSDIQSRVLDVLKGFEKVNQTNLSPTASFSKDLGLDSLDAVEVVMAIEEEFSIEIPDAEADEILTVQQAIDYIAKTPEGRFMLRPVYDPTTSTLHFVDIQEKRVYHVDVESLEVNLEQFEETVACLSLCATGPGFRLAGAAAQGFALLPGDSKLEYISKPLPAGEIPYTRFNDGACDSKGRFFAGTLYSPKHGIPGRLYRYDPSDKTCAIADPGPFTDSNGLGWSPDEKTFYFTDSFKNVIYAYDYDDGKISNRRVLVDAMALGLPENSFCDGLCVDKEGFIWSCRWGGSQIVRFTKDGVIDLVIRFPTVYSVTACCFGGPNDDQLFVTTAHCGANGGDASLQEKFPDSGHIFCVDMSARNVRGGLNLVLSSDAVYLKHELSSPLANLPDLESSVTSTIRSPKAAIQPQQPLERAKNRITDYVIHQICVRAHSSDAPVTAYPSLLSDTMKHGVAFRKFSRTSSHRMLMLRNLVTSLFEHEQIRTTLPKARDTARLAEKIISLGKKNTQASYNQASAFLLKRDLLPRVFGQFAQRYADRPGGYTRIHKFGNRRGDNAPEAIVELVDNPRDLRWELTSRAVGWDVMRKKLRGNGEPHLNNLVNESHEDMQQILKDELELPSDSRRGILREKTRWNLQKLLKYRSPNAVEDIAGKASSHMDELLATPVAYKALHEEKKDNHRKLPPRLHAGQLVPGDRRSAAQLAQGQLGLKPPSTKGPVLTLKRVFGRNHKTA
ncbi:hypothetical protein NP233_g5477 [Leucocoprinus birnbaumii]|uniref:Acyl carrier protein n=1 Tax=Leucocoprinus birnbaumii TaxID=56174 RepID=A0AAD5YRV5_9AGAR|nr:hypothetical protein NP233_g5477 [Leucocoprinus birnbaumii]